MARRRMRATTVRFSRDLWAMVEAGAEAAGVSVAQFVRDAALTRVVYAAGRRGDPMYDAAAADAASSLRALESGDSEGSALTSVRRIRNEASELREESEALRHQ